MLPIVDYGDIVLVVPKINAVGGLSDDSEKFGFEVFMTGMHDAFFVEFSTKEEAEEAREKLVAVIAHYYYVKEFGPEFDLDAFEDDFEEECSATEDTGEDDESGDRH